MEIIIISNCNGVHMGHCRIHYITCGERLENKDLTEQANKQVELFVDHHHFFC